MNSPDLASSTSILERRSRRWQSAARCVMSVVLVAACWSSGSLRPVRAVLPLGFMGSGPSLPTEEHENHSGSPVEMELQGGARSRVKVRQPEWRLARAVPRAQGVRAPLSTLPAGALSDGHRLSNRLMAPILI
jgi:hypothetical protein